jgi:hypothetical protein
MFTEIIERANNQDRLYFEANQDATEYIRAYIPGEFYPLEYSNCRLVKVKQIFPGLRSREPIFTEGKFN